VVALAAVLAVVAKLAVPSDPVDRSSSATCVDFDTGVQPQRREDRAILQVPLEDDVAGHVRNLHAHFGFDRLLTVRPEVFAITDLSPADSSQPPRTEFHGDIVHGHFENGGDVVGAGTLIRVDDVVTFRELPLPSPGSATSGEERSELAYLPVGDADEELFLAHVITAAPDFDQVLRVSESGAHFTRTDSSGQATRPSRLPSRTCPPSASTRKRRLSGAAGPVSTSTPTSR
jgi:hypothetical protein